MVRLLRQSRDLLAGWAQLEREREEQMQGLYSKRGTREEIETELDQIERQRTALISATESLLSLIIQELPNEASARLNQGK